METIIDNKLLWERFTEENEELIVTAVNACKAINPDNPINAAKAYPDVIKALQEAYKELQFHNWHNNKTGFAIEAILKQATQ